MVPHPPHHGEKKRGKWPGGDDGRRRCGRGGRTCPPTFDWRASKNPLGAPGEMYFWGPDALSQSTDRTTAETTAKAVSSAGIRPDPTEGNVPTNLYLIASRSGTVRGFVKKGLGVYCGQSD